MPCHFPLTAYKGRIINPQTGKRPLAFNTRDGYHDTQLKIACSQCRGCRRDRAKQWALRCLHEASQHKENCFITLTFNDKYINSIGSLEKPASKKGDIPSKFQLFMKRLRIYVSRNVYDPQKGQYVPLKRKHWIRPAPKLLFYHCGEYGSIYGRPHHHACIFNHSFKDKQLWKDNGRNKLYRSPMLEHLWSNPDNGESYGYSSIGDVTYDSAAYVAGYIHKKLNGSKAPDHYQGRQPEYATMSRRPGIGKSWFDKYSSDISNQKALILPGGFNHKIPKYYDRMMELTNPDSYDQIIAERIQRVRAETDNEQHRLYTKSLVEDGRYNLKKRPLE